MTTLLLIGFGRFPGARFNPTGPLVERLAALRRPALADVTLVTHVFATSYAAVDRELPALLTRHRPDALLMFGLAPRAKVLRIETRARNTLTLLPDAGGHAAGRTRIAAGGPSALALPMPAPRLLAALHSARVPASLSRDAGPLSVQLPHLARRRSRGQARRAAAGHLHSRAARLSRAAAHGPEAPPFLG